MAFGAGDGMNAVQRAAIETAIERAEEDLYYTRRMQAACALTPERHAEVLASIVRDIAFQEQRLHDLREGLHDEPMTT